MYKINKAAKELIEIKPTTFKKIEALERQDIQQWIKSTPNIFGEELLFIAEEYNNWDTTEERLDLLALDKEGRLVIIENKRDDSGTNVTWQALKYAAYCSTITPNQIIDIYMNFKHLNQDEAKDEILTFLSLNNNFDDNNSLENLELNKNNTQRIILTSNSFRKEVTSAVYWLINNQINIKCFELTPYLSENDLLLSVEQILPPKDIEDFIVKNAEKQKEEDTSNIRGKLYRNFWEIFVSECRKSDNIYAHRNTTKGDYLQVTLIQTDVKINCEARQKACRVVITLQSADERINKARFDQLYTHRDEIQNKLQYSLNWERKEGQQQSRITKETTSYDITNKQHWNDIHKFFIKTTKEFIKVFTPYIKNLD